MEQGLARAITIGSIVLTVASLTLAVVFARKASRIRIGFDLARAGVGVGAILVMAAVTGVTTPGAAIALAIAVGLALGFTQGSALEVTAGERGFYAQRSPLGIVLWGAGIIVMQGAGIASRTGTVRIGQTIAWFSACLGIGLMTGRNGPLQDAKKAFAGAGVAALVAVLLAPALIAGTANPAVALADELTDDEVCDLIAPVTSNLYAATGLLPGRDFHTRFTGVEPLAPVANAVAACRQEGYETYTGQGFVEYTVYLFASVDDAQDQYAAEVVANEAWYAPEWEDAQEWMEHSETGLTLIGTGPLDDYDVVGVYWITYPAIRVVMTTGPFMLYGVVTDTLAYGYGPMNPDRTHQPDRFLIETLLIPMSDTVHNIDAFLASADPGDESSPPPPVDGGEGTDDAVSGVDVDGSEGTDDAPRPAGDADEPVTPEEAAGQAIAGLIAAAAMGVITWAEAGAEIGRILGGGPLPPTYAPPPPQTTTVVLTGADAEAVLSGGVGTNVPTGDQQWGQNVSVPDGTIRTDPVGSRGVVRSVGPIVRGPDGQISISVEVGPPPPPPTPPPPPERIDLDPNIGPEPEIWPPMPRRPPPLDPHDDTLTPADLSDRDFRDWLDKQQRFGEKVAGWHREQGAIMNALHEAADWTYWGADISIHLLANLTGPLGQGVKENWNIAKHLARATGRSLVDGNWSENMLRSGTEFWTDKAWSKGFDWLAGITPSHAPGLSSVPLLSPRIPGQMLPRLNISPSQMSQSTRKLVTAGTWNFGRTRLWKVIGRNPLKNLPGIFDWSPPWPNLP